MKSTALAGTQHLTGLGAFAEDHPTVQRRILVCLEPRKRTLASGIEVMPASMFLRELWRGGIA